MRTSSTCRVVQDSDSEAETTAGASTGTTAAPTPSPDAVTSSDAVTSPQAAYDRALPEVDCDSDSDPRPKKKAGRKPKARLPASGTDVREDDQSTGNKSKRISWSAHPTQAAFLDNALDNILTANKPQRRALKKRAKKDFLKKWPTFGRYTRQEIDKGIDNWFKNHTQFPHLRNPSTATTVEEPEGTEDADSLSFPDNTHPAPARTASNPNSIALAPLLKSIRRRARGPSGWWALEHHEEVQALQTKLGGDIGALRRAVFKLYNRLSNEEKVMWEEKAADEKEKLSQDEKQCFRNQDDFPLLVATLLGSFISYDPQQVGSAVIYFRMAMRTETGAIQHDQYTVGLSDDDDSFDVFAGSPKQDEIDRWANYVDAVLPENPVQRDERLTYGADGLPKLPPYDDEWTVAQARSALEAWFQAMWMYGLERNVDLPNGLDWSNFANTVAPYLPSAWMDRVDSKPSDRPFHHVVTLYHDLFEAQATPNAFRWTASTLLNPTRTISPNGAPHTPSKAMRIMYTTPTKPSAPRSQTHVSSTSSAHKLPRPVFPTADVLADGHETVPRASSPDQGMAEEHDHSGIVVASPVRGVAVCAALDTNDNVSPTMRDTWASPFSDMDVAITQDAQTASQVARETAVVWAASALRGTEGNVDTVSRTNLAAGDTGVESARDPASNQHTGADQDGGATNGAPDTSHARVRDAGGSSSPTGDSNERLHVTHAHVNVLSGQDATTGAPTHPATGKRKREPRPSMPSSKCSKTPTGRKTVESASAVGRRAPRRLAPPPGSPRRTRGAVEREAREAAAREAVANTAQT